MKNFFKPTKRKITIFITLFLYAVAGVASLAALSCEPCITPPAHPAVESILSIFFFPILLLEALFYGAAMLHTNTTETSTLQILREHGMVGSANGIPDETIIRSSPTALGYALGVLAVLLALYILACVVALFFKN